VDQDGAPWSLAVPEPDETQIARMRELLASGFQSVDLPPVRGGALIRRLPAWLPGVVRSTGTNLMRRSSRRKFASADRQPSLRLHLGCGWVYKDGWINIDLFMTRADIAWDLAAGLPLHDASVDTIFHEHLMEHLTLQQGDALTKECLRVLKPDGILRIGVPDAGACVASYAGLVDPGWARSQPTGLLAVQALFYEHGHKAMYDAETLSLMCRASGFQVVQARDWGDSGIEPVPDTESRKGGTLYVECVK
jgi:predicted SAM-dependent methyltransferase